MKTVLVGINAKYIHSNLAIHSIRCYAHERGVSMDIAEYTINHQVDDILDQLYMLKADVLAFSCYIWNIDMVHQLLGEIHKIMPETIVILGGPGVSYDGASYFENYKCVDYVVSGEGEETMFYLAKALEKKDSIRDLPGLIYKEDEKIVINPPTNALNMDDLPFIYEAGLHEFDHRILYYESSRGCPFNCQYCLSSIDKGVRYRSIDQVKKEFQWFLDQKVKQVKLVDRTFNCHEARTNELWQYLINHDNGVTLFHFEIAADILTEQSINILNTARPGLIQLEIGVQSTNEKTLKLIQRVTDFKRISAYVKKIQAGGNVHIHLDLIAGLPVEGYERFSKSFDDVYGLGPDQLQLGFLKVLKGTGMRSQAVDCGMIYRDYAPYEILYTKDLNHDEMVRLKQVESVLELFYNSGHFRHTINYVESFYITAFKMYESFGDFFISQGGHLLKHSKLSLYTMLRNFALLLDDIDKSQLDCMLKYDLMLNEKIKKYPDWLAADVNYEHQKRAFYRKEMDLPKYLSVNKGDSAKNLSRRYHLERFVFNVLTGEHTPTVVLFDYNERSYLNHEAKTHHFEMEEFQKYILDDLNLKS